MSLGPIMCDLRGCELAAEEREMLRHSLVGGVILFARNYQSTDQLTELVTDIHSAREPRLLVATDHEGGRVQRFREGFTRLPPFGIMGKMYKKDKEQATGYAEQSGWLAASELRAVGIDFSFSPVLDLHKGISEVIGDRAIDRDPKIVSLLARNYVQGMKRAGMSAVGKHFPGHGSVLEDSHIAMPVDRRALSDIQKEDMVPFMRLIENGLAGIMPAHVIYPKVDAFPVGYSSVWLKKILRGRLGFQGAIFSDDIDMAGAEFAGSYPERAAAALAAGCDMVLICNNQKEAVNVLDNLNVEADLQSQSRLIRMHGRHDLNLKDLQQDQEWRQVSAFIAKCDETPELDLGNDAI